jgi:hypothetical protein
MQEIKDLEKRFMLQVGTNKDKSCIRAVLRGKAVDGSAGPDMVRVMEGGPNLDACLALLEEKNEALGQALFSGKASGQGLKQVRPPHDPGFDRELLEGLVVACAPLIDAVQSAVSHAEACSPYLPGKRGMPGLVVQIRIARLLSGAALLAHVEGDNTRAFELLLDGLRFDQDMDRGGVSWLIPMISRAADMHTLSTAAWLLGQPEPLGQDLLAQIDRELLTLIESEPHPSSFIQGDYHDMVMHVLMRSIKGDRWSPPGGWHEGEEPVAPAGDEKNKSAHFKTLTLGADEADDNALAWLAMEELAAQERRACPPSTTPDQCYENLVQLASELQEGASMSTLKWLKKMTEFLLAWDPDARKRDFVVDVLKSIASSAPRYVALQGQRRFHAAALRVQAAFRLMAEKTGRCPGLEDFESEPLSGLAVDPNSNQPMVVEQGPDGVLVLSSKSFKDARDVELRFVLSCPL